MALRNKEISKIKAYLNQWNDVFDDVFFRPSLGQASLIEVAGILDSIKNKLNTVVKNRESISRELLTRINSKNDKLISYALSVKEFEDGIYVADRNSIIKTIEEYNDGVLEWWPSVAAVTNFASESNEYVSFIKEAKEELEKNAKKGAVSYTHMTLPTTPYV